MTNKLLFEKFSNEHEKNLPFSLQFKWWNEVVKTDWDVIVQHNDEQISAIWPYQIRKRGPWKMIVQPHFTPYSGLYIHNQQIQKNTSKYSYDLKVSESMIAKLPVFDELKQNFHLAFVNSLPFIWAGFEDLKRFTYILNLQEQVTFLWSNLRDSIRRQIRKAQKTITIEATEDSEILEKLFKETFQSQKTSYPIDDNEIIKRIITYIKKHQTGSAFLARDHEKNIHACMVTIADHSTSYYLFGGSAIKHKNSGAMSLLMWTALLDAKEKGLKAFNFEGSSIPSIEHFLRGFGGDLHTFSCIKKSNSDSLKLARKLKG